MGYRQQRIDKNSIASAKRRKEQEARKLLQTTAILHPTSTKLEPKSKEPVFPEILCVYILIFSVTIISFLIAKMFAYFGLMGLAIFLDAVCYPILAKRARGSRYLPFLWWVLCPKK